MRGFLVFVVFPRESTREVSLEVIDIRGLHDCIYYMMWFALQIVSSRKHLLLQNVTQTTTSGLFCYLSNPVSIGLMNTEIKLCIRLPT